MKSMLKPFLLLLSVIAAINFTFAQNTFPWPSTGNIGIGNSSPGTLLDVGAATIPPFVPQNSSISAIQTRTLGANAANIHIGNSFYAEQSVANNNSFETAQFYSISSFPSGNVARTIPVFVYHNYSGGGTTGEVRMIQSIGALTGTGAVTNWYGFEGSINTSGTGTITNAYGLYLAPLTGNVTNKYGVYVNDANATNYFGGKIGVGTVNTFGYQLAVNGSAIFTRAVVKLYANWPDYVFEKKYKLPALATLEKFIQDNHHLPDMPSAKEIKEKGIDLGANQALLLKKIEELTLYTINQQKQIDALQQENKKIESLQAQVTELKTLLTKKHRP